MTTSKAKYFIEFHIQKPNTVWNNNQIDASDCEMKEDFTFRDYDNKQTIRNLKEYFISFFGHKYKLCTCQMMCCIKDTHVFTRNFFVNLNRSETTLLITLNSMKLSLIKVNEECNCDIKEYNKYLTWSKSQLISDIKQYKEACKNAKNEIQNLGELKKKIEESDDLKKEELDKLRISYNKIIKIHENDNSKDEECYDIIIDINSMKDLQKKGLNVKMSEKGKENYEAYKNEKLLKIGVIGSSKKGKSYVLSKISNINLITGSSNQTNGLSVKYPDKNNKLKRNFILLDCAGLENPILNNDNGRKKEEEKKEEEKNEDENKEVINNIKEEEENEFNKESEFKEKVKDKIMTDFFLQNFILKNSDILLVIVGMLTYSEQLLIKKIKEECKKEKKNKLFIIHNLQTLRKKEQIEQYINNILKKSSSFNLEEINSNYFGNDNNEKNNDNENDIIFENNEENLNKIEEENLDKKQENNNFIINNLEKKELKINDEDKEGILDKYKNDDIENNTNEDEKNEFNIINNNKIKENELKEENKIEINEIKNDNQEEDKPCHFSEVIKYGDKQQILVYHLIIANDESDAGKFYNEDTYNYIKKFFDQSAGLNSFDLFEEIKNTFKYVSPIILSKQIEDIKFYSNEDIIDKKLIKLESKEDLILKDCFFEEGNSFFKTSGFQPKYNCYKSDDNTLEIRLEIPGNITYNIEKYVEKDKTKIKVTGNKKQDKFPPKEENIIYNNREFTNYEVIIPLPTEKYLIASENPKEGYPQQKGGLLSIQYELSSKGKIISNETKEEDEV